MRCEVPLPRAIQAELQSWRFRRGFEWCDAGIDGNLDPLDVIDGQIKIHWCSNFKAESFRISIETTLQDWPFQTALLYCEVRNQDCNLPLESKSMQEEAGYSSPLSAHNDAFLIFYNGIPTTAFHNGEGNLLVTCEIPIWKVIDVVELSLALRRQINKPNPSAAAFDDERNGRSLLKQERAFHLPEKGTITHSSHALGCAAPVRYAGLKAVKFF